MCRTTEVYVERGIEQGIKQGLQKGTDIINKLNQILLETGRLEDLKRATADSEYQNKLIEELIPTENKG